MNILGRVYYGEVKEVFSIIFVPLIILTVYIAMTKLYVDRPVINSVRQPFIENTYLDRGVILDVYGQNLSEVFAFT